MSRVWSSGARTCVWVCGLVVAGCADSGSEGEPAEFETRSQSIVGDGVLDGGEECDDGNTAAGDGCDASGDVEDGYNCSTNTLPSRCAPDITEIHTNGDGGYWFSAVDDLNGGGAGSCGSGACATPWSQGGMAPDVTHDLLAFTWAGETYSTGVDDATLDAQGVAYAPSKWRGLPVGPIPLSGAGNVQYGSFLDGNVGSTLGLDATIFGGEVFFSDASALLRDGARGLGLNSFINNVEYTNTYRLPVLDPAKMGDGIPDFLFINGASTTGNRGGAEITLRWQDAAGVVVVEDQISVAKEAARPLQRPRTDFTRTSNGTSGGGNALRDPGSIAFDASYFGVTPGNASSIKFLEVLVNIPGGNAVDPDVFAYNEFSTLPALFTCGDGDLDAGEECDDGNNVSNDGCQANCFIEDAYECFPSVAQSRIADDDGDLIPDEADADFAGGPDDDGDGIVDDYDVDDCALPECTGDDEDNDGIDDGRDLDGLDDDDGDSNPDGNDGIEDGAGPSLCLPPTSSCGALGNTFSMRFGASQVSAPPALGVSLAAGASDTLVNVLSQGEVDVEVSVTQGSAANGAALDADSAAGQTVSLEFRPTGKTGITTVGGLKLFFDDAGVGTIEAIRITNPFGVTAAIPFNATQILSGALSENGAGELEVGAGRAVLDLSAYLVGRIEIDFAAAAPDFELDATAGLRSCLAVCGNGAIEPGEGCDDGNLRTGDGCDAACLVESGSVCNNVLPGELGDASCATGACNEVSGVCAASAACGNGVVDAGEGCDDGNAVARDGCDAECRVEGAGAPCDEASDCATGSCDVAAGACLVVGACGDGTLDPGEGCDDGDVVPGDGCDGTCAVEPGAACASGSACASGLCDVAAGSCVAPGCGNGVLESGEGCDDGGLVAGDGCDASCLIEDGGSCNFSAPGLAGSASCAVGVCDVTGGAIGLDPPTCRTSISSGNGTLETGEGCDDGDSDPGDGCNTSGLIEIGFPCNSSAPGLTGAASCEAGAICNYTSGAPGVCASVNLCGNGALESGEGCDDGNVVPGDGCDASCKVETGGVCNRARVGARFGASCQTGVCDRSGAPPRCEALDVCGNGIVEPGESCDDGGTAPGDGCDSSCALEDGGACVSAGDCQSGLCASNTCVASNICGNLTLEAGEGCDGGATCTVGCKLVVGQACNTTIPGATLGSSCDSGVCDTTESTPACEAVGVCGNGVLDVGEGCDDGARANGDGCDDLCRIENSSPCTVGASCASGTCSAGTCVSLNVCGNGILEVGEGCDGGAGCTVGCKLVVGETCNTSAPGETFGPSCDSGVCDTTEVAPTCEAAGGVRQRRRRGR